MEPDGSDIVLLSYFDTNEWHPSVNHDGMIVFYFHAHSSWLFGSSPASTASRTIAGQFGARAAKLLDYLGGQHHGVKLSEEDFHRMTLWLDCNSEFYGAYENAEAQARGEVVHPSLD